MEHADVKVNNEEIVIHPVARRVGEKWIVECRVIGEVVINGDVYQFNKIIRQGVDKAEKESQRSK